MAINKRITYLISALLFSILLMGIASAGPIYVYDNFGDGVNNWVLWKNSTSGFGQNRLTVTESGNQMIADADFASGGTGSYTIWSENFTNLLFIKNINYSIQWSISTGAGASMSYTVQTLNQTVFSQNIGENAASSGSTTISLYRNPSGTYHVNNGTAWTTNITPSGGDIFESVSCSGNNLCSDDVRFGAITFETYGVWNNLTSPSNNTFLGNNFTFIVNNTAILDFNLTNVTYSFYYANGSLKERAIMNLTGKSNTSIYNSSTFPIFGLYNWEAYTCGTNGSLHACYNPLENKTFTSGFLLNSVTYNPSVLGTSNENFILNINLSDLVTTSSAVLVYNNTRYTSTKATASGVTTFSNNLDVPVVTSSTTKDFYWELTLNNILVNTSTYTQTVTPILFGLCNGTLANQVLNFTTYDSATSLRLNASLEATFELFAEDGSGEAQEFNFQDLNENRSNWVFCLNSTTSNITTNAFISYFATGYDRREYIISNGTISNILQTINLFLAATADTDVVTITVQDQNYNPLSGALIAIQQWDIGTNSFNTIGMFYTDNQGQGIINLELYNIWYRAVVTYGGTIVEITEPQKLADTTWEIQVDLEDENPYSIFNTIVHGLTFNNVTNITEFSWIDTSGFVQQGCLQIRESTSLGYQTVRLECTSSVSSSINYQLNATGQYEITGIIYLVPAYNISQITDVIYVRMSVDELVATVSPYGKALSFIFIGTSAAIGISAGSPILGGLLFLGSTFLSGKLGWMNITESIFWGLLSIVIVLLFRLSRRT